MYTFHDKLVLKGEYMRKILILFAISILASCNSMQTSQDLLPLQQEVKIQSDTGVIKGLTEFFKRTFKSYDSNNDGYISEFEYKTQLSGGITVNSGAKPYGFSELDLNKDHKISKVEFVKTLVNTQTTKDFRNNIKKVIQTADSNSDGLLNKKEFLNTIGIFAGSGISVLASDFEKSDLNKDGVLDQSEFEDFFVSVCIG